MLVVTPVAAPAIGATPANGKARKAARKAQLATTPVATPANGKARKAARKAQLATTPVATPAVLAVVVAAPTVAPPVSTGFAAALATLPTPAPTPAVAVRVKLGVNPNARTRARCAALTIAHYGHAAGVGAAQIAHCGKLYGTPNLVEDEICLRNAWHAIAAYCVATGLATAPGGILAVPAKPAA